MHLKNQKPVLMHWQFVEEFERMSKAALMDLAWSMAVRLCGHEGDAAPVVRVLRGERDRVLLVRKQLKEIQEHA